MQDRTVRKRSTFLPKSKYVFAAMKLATTPDASAALMETWGSKVSEARMEDNPAVQEMALLVAEHAQFVILSDPNNANPWDREVAASRTEQFNKRLTDLATKDLATQKLTYTFAIEPGEPLKRGYFNEDGNAVATKERLGMDLWFDRWLKDRDLINQGSFIYERGEGEKAKVDPEGNPVRVSDDKLKTIILDEKTGFEAYMRKNVKGIELDVEDLSPEIQAAPSSEAGI